MEDKSKKTKAERLAFDLLEYLDQINYNKYYESMGAVGTRGGEKEKLFSDFSSQSIKAAQVAPNKGSVTSVWVCVSYRCCLSKCRPLSYTTLTGANTIPESSGGNLALASAVCGARSMTAAAKLYVIFIAGSLSALGEYLCSRCCCS